MCAVLRQRHPTVCNVNHLEVAISVPQCHQTLSCVVLCKQPQIPHNFCYSKRPLPKVRFTQTLVDFVHPRGNRNRLPPGSKGTPLLAVRLPSTLARLRVWQSVPPPPAEDDPGAAEPLQQEAEELLALVAEDIPAYSPARANAGAEVKFCISRQSLGFEICFCLFEQ